MAGFEEHGVDGAHPAQVAFGAFDAGVVKVLVGSRFFGVHVVAGVGAEGYAVRIFPHLDGNDA